MRARPRAWNFIREHLDRIHHLPAIHAKTVISDSLAMMGSANLTATGILGRTELGVLIEEPTLVQELNQWFADLWAETMPPIVDETSAFVQWLDEEASRNPTRRQRTALSSSVKKVRGKLVTIEIPPRTTSPTPLQLDSVAAELVLEEQRHYDSLEESLQAAIYTLVRTGFTLGDAVRYVKAVFPDALVREIYFGLLQQTTNHVRTVFAEDTRNRLALSGGKFIQSDMNNLRAGLFDFDHYLRVIVSALDFTSPSELPSEEVIESETGFRGAEHTILIAELLETGFLILEDIAGHVPLYRLDAEFDWVSRFKFFASASAAWREKKGQCDQYKESFKAYEDNDDVLDAPADYRLIPVLGTDEGENEKIPDFDFEVSPYIESETDLERQTKIDKVLAHTMEKLFRGEHVVFKNRKSRSIEAISEATGVGANLVLLVLRGQARNAPRVTTMRQQGVEDRKLVINSGLDWSDLVGYPLTEAVVKSFLGKAEWQ